MCSFMWAPRTIIMRCRSYYKFALVVASLGYNMRPTRTNTHCMLNDDMGMCGCVMHLFVDFWKLHGLPILLPWLVKVVQSFSVPTHFYLLIHRTWKEGGEQTSHVNVWEHWRSLEVYLSIIGFVTFLVLNKQLLTLLMDKFASIVMDD